MSHAEFEEALFLALRLNAARLPKRPGTGKNFVPAIETDKAIRILAKSMAEHMLRANVKPYKGPPASPHAAAATAS